MNEEEILLNYLKDENWKYFHEDGIPYKTIFMQDRDILIKYITQLQNNWNELKNYLEKQIIDSKSASSQQYYFNTIYKLMQELEQGKDD